MPDMSKGNARQMLQRTLTRFNQVTGQRIAAVFTWEGELSVIANSEFTDFIQQHKDAVWKSIACSNAPQSIPSRDLEMVENIDKDLNDCSVKSLRSMISWVTQKSIGTTRHFWGNPSKKPNWWPGYIPFENIARKTFTKWKLLKVINAYKHSNCEASLPIGDTETVRERSPLHSCDELNNPEIEDTAEMYSSLDDQDVSSTINESSILDVPEVYEISTALNQTFEISNDSFLPGISAPGVITHVSSEQPESTFQDVLPTCSTSSLAILSHAQAITPLNVTFSHIEDQVKEQFLSQLSNPKTLLSGSCMNSFMDLLKKCFPGTLGLQDTILAKNREFRKASINSIQIHHDGNLHWVCSRITSEGVFLYDSYFSGRTTEELDVELALLYATNESELKVHVIPVQQQRGVADCGLFAAAVCLALVSGDDPAKIRWRQCNMRKHLTKCIESGYLQPFPTIQTAKPESTSPSIVTLTIEIWCVCRLPQFAYKYMTACEKCNRWFHKECIGLPDNADEVADFPCPLCSQNIK